jgi:hypothetical protein
MYYNLAFTESLSSFNTLFMEHVFISLTIPMANTIDL